MDEARRLATGEDRGQAGRHAPGTGRVGRPRTGLEDLGRNNLPSLEILASHAKKRRSLPKSKTAKMWL